MQLPGPCLSPASGPLAPPPAWCGLQPALRLCVLGHLFLPLRRERVCGQGHRDVRTDIWAGWEGARRCWGPGGGCPAGGHAAGGPLRRLRYGGHIWKPGAEALLGGACPQVSGAWAEGTPTPASGCRSWHWRWARTWPEAGTRHLPGCYVPGGLEGQRAAWRTGYCARGRRALSPEALSSVLPGSLRRLK